MNCKYYNDLFFEENKLTKKIRPVNSCQCCSLVLKISTPLVSLPEHLGSAVCAAGGVITSVTLTFLPGDLPRCAAVLSEGWRDKLFLFFAVLLSKTSSTSVKQSAKMQLENCLWQGGASMKTPCLGHTQTETLAFLPRQTRGRMTVLSSST